ncbi:MAG: molybdopterin-dependent oxidoreductase [Caldilineaceae bacterium]
MTNHHTHQHDPLQPHSHDPNPEPPGADPTVRFEAPTGATAPITVTDLQALPQVALSDCYIVSTGHGASGPFTFGGPTLLSLVEARLGMDVAWSQVEVVSADGFGTRIARAELVNPTANRAIILACQLDGAALTRQQGLVRLIVPSERDDALRQVKWIEVVRVK